MLPGRVACALPGTWASPQLRGTVRLWEFQMAACVCPTSGDSSREGQEPPPSPAASRARPPQGQGHSGAFSTFLL